MMSVEKHLRKEGRSEEIIEQAKETYKYQWFELIAAFVLIFAVCLPVFLMSFELLIVYSESVKIIFRVLFTLRFVLHTLFAVWIMWHFEEIVSIMAHGAYDKLYGHGPVIAKHEFEKMKATNELLYDSIKKMSCCKHGETYKLCFELANELGDGHVELIAVPSPEYDQEKQQFTYVNRMIYVRNDWVFDLLSCRQFEYKKYMIARQYPIVLYRCDAKDICKKDFETFRKDIDQHLVASS